MSTSQAEYVIRRFNEHDIRERQTDRYYDATAMCKANKKQWGHYWSNKTTQEFMLELSKSIGIPMDQLAETKNTGSNSERGTYVHPRVATHLAQWCSPKFAVVVSGWVLDILTTGKAEVVQAPADPIMAVGEAIVLMRRAQIEHERKLATVEEKADRALQQAEAAARAADNNYGWFTVLGYCNRTGRRVTEQESARHGKHLSDMLRKRGVEKRKTAQSRWGTVGLYPEALLMEYFGDRLPADYPGPWPQLFEAHA